MNKEKTAVRKLTVIIPVYNEESTVYSLLERVARVNLIDNIAKELITVDDASTDDTGPEIKRFTRDHPGIEVTYIRHGENKGKGAALHTGIARATGDHLIIQDADMEYDPQEFNALLRPVVDGFADVVYGSRFAGGNPHRILFFWHSIGNRILTMLSNIFTNLNLTDMETCYKLFRSDIIKGIQLKEKRFGFEPEVTAKISRIPGIAIYEVGISYFGRTYKEGKKISWTDGLRAIYCILKYNLFR